MDTTWKELIDKINDALYVSVNLESLVDVLVNEFDFTNEEAEKIMDELYDLVDAERDQIQEDLITTLCASVYEYMRAKNIKLYPEDAPGQLHLFELE